MIESPKPEVSAATATKSPTTEKQSRPFCNAVKEKTHIKKSES
jgi:hypothetical protein